MKKSVAVLLMAFPMLTMAWPWSTDMMNQPSVKPQEGVMKPFPKRSVPVGGYPTPQNIKSAADAISLTNPIPVSAKSLRKGRQLFRIYCGACHGLDGKAKSPVAQKMHKYDESVNVRDLTGVYVQNQLSEGWIWGTITFGSMTQIMPAYGSPLAHPEQRGSNDLSPEERWHVVNYVKHGLMKESTATKVAHDKAGH